MTTTHPTHTLAGAVSALAALPTGGVIRIYATGERITPESAEHGDAAERGWTTRVGSPDLYDARNDVAPLFEARIHADYLIEEGYALDTYDDTADAHACALDTVRDILTQLQGGWESHDGSTFYAADAMTLDYTTADVFTYAVHASVKHYDGTRGWVEDDVNLLDLFGHAYTTGRMTGTRTCERCGMLPLDSDDMLTPCPGTR